MKKSVALLLALLLTAGCFSGCGKKQSAGNGDLPAPQLLAGGSFSMAEQALPDFPAQTEQVLFTGSTLYCLQKQESQSLYAIDVQSGATRTLLQYPCMEALDASLDTTVRFIGCFSGPQDSLWVVEHCTAEPSPFGDDAPTDDADSPKEEPKVASIYRLRQCLPDGQTSEPVQVSEFFHSFECGIAVENGFVIAANQYLYAFAPTGETLSVYPQAYPTLALTTYRGGVASITRDSLNRVCLQILETAHFSLNSTISLPFSMDALDASSSRYGSFLSGSDTTLYYTCQGNLFACDAATAQVEKATEWLDFGINTSRIVSQFRLADGTIHALCRNPDGSMRLLTLTPASQEKSTTAMTLAMLSHNEATLDLVLAFNQGHPEQKIRVVNYGEYAAFGFAPQAMLYRQVTKGSIPDMIFSANRDLPVTELTPGLLTDLTPYLSADKALLAEGILPSVLEVQTQEGKLLSVAPNFVLSTAISTNALVGSGSLSVTRAMNLFALYSTEETSVQEQFLKQETVLREHIARNSLLYGVDQTIHLNFNNTSYQEGLLYTAQYPRNIDLDQYGSEGPLPGWARVRGGQQLFFSGTYYGFSALSQNLYATGEGAILCGFPDVAGGHVLELWETYGISEASPHKELAWSFIRTTLLADAQAFAPGLGFPSNLAAFRAAGEDAMAASGAKELRYGSKTLTVPLQLSQTQYDMILAAAKSAKARYHSDPDLFAALWAQAQKYLNGQQDLSSAAANAQSAAEHYRDVDYTH